LTKHLNKNHRIESVPEAATHAVVVMMPLWSIRWRHRDEGRLKSFEEYQRRLEQIVSYMASQCAKAE
jgi:hypothetical protein